VWAGQLVAVSFYCLIDRLVPAAQTCYWALVVWPSEQASSNWTVEHRGVCLKVVLRTIWNV